MRTTADHTRAADEVVFLPAADAKEATYLGGAECVAWLAFG